MKRSFAFCYLYLSLVQSAFCQDQAFLKVFWNNVYSRYHYKEMTAGMSSWLYQLAEKQTGKYSEAKALLGQIQQNTNFQNEIFLSVYVQEGGNKEYVRLIFANLCGSFSIGNPVADYVCLKYSNDPLAKKIIAQKKEESKSLKKEEKVKDSVVNKSDEVQPEVKIQEAEFPGGISAYQRFLANNLKIPDSAVGINGNVIVEFIIDTAGKVKDARIISPPLGHGLETEALRVINLLPTWLPAREGNIPKASTRTQSFSF